MIANPPHLTRREVEGMNGQRGSGPVRSWSVPRADAPPLVFQIRLPFAIELVDVPSFARASCAPVATPHGAAGPERGAGPAGVVATGVLRPTTVPLAERDILATMTVALFDEVKAPLSAEDFRVPEFERTARSHVEVTRLSDRVTQILRVGLESRGEGTEPLPMLVMQYLLRTPYGALAMAFSTTHPQMMGRWGRRLYLRIVEMIFIGERAQPS